MLGNWQADQKKTTQQQRQPEKSDYDFRRKPSGMTS